MSIQVPFQVKYVTPSGLSPDGTGKIAGIFFNSAASPNDFVVLNALIITESGTGKVAKINLVNADTAPSGVSGWNDFIGDSVQSVALNDPSGTSTGWTIAYLGSLFNDSGDDGAADWGSAPSGDSDFPELIAQTFYYISSTFWGNFELDITGLDITKTYSILVCSYYPSGGDAPFSGTFQTNTQTCGNHDAVLNKTLFN